MRSSSPTREKQQLMKAETPARIIKKMTLPESITEIDLQTFAQRSRIPSAATIADELLDPEEHAVNLKYHRVLHKDNVQVLVDPVQVGEAFTWFDDLQDEEEDSFDEDELFLQVLEEEPEEPVDAETLRARWEEEWEEKLQEQVSKASAEAYERGLTAAAAEAATEIEQAKEQFLQGLGALEDSFRQSLKQTEPVLAEMAFLLAEMVLDASLPPKLVEKGRSLLPEAIEQLSGDAPIHINVNPADFLFFQESGMVERAAAAHKKVLWHSDSHLRSGEWVVQSPKSAIRRITHEILEGLKENICADTDWG